VFTATRTTKQAPAVLRAHDLDVHTVQNYRASGGRLSTEFHMPISQTGKQARFHRQKFLNGAALNCV
jgi:hypothetical protein